MRSNWPWVAGGAIAIAVGLAVWETTFVLVPVGVVLIGVVVVSTVRQRKETIGEP